MSMLQPTIRRFPKTADTLADSNLPFSCVVTPMKEPSSKDPKTQLTQKIGLSHHNYPLLTSIPKCTKCGAPHPTKETHFWPYPYSMSSSSAPSFLVCYLCGGKTTNDKLPPPSSIMDPHASSDRLLPQIYQIPLFSTPEVTYWSLPAHSCPPVCWFLLDGSCTHRSYWNTMSHVLLQIIDDIPPHVHVGILLAATVPSSASEEAATTISYVDLTSPVPHILQLVQYAGEEDDEEEVRQRDVTASTSGGTSSDGLLDKLSLVPANSLHLPNIHAAIRSLVDYDPTQLATTQRAYTMSMPLGRSIETILDFMDRAQHPGAISPTSPLKISSVAGGDGIDASSYNNNNALEDQLWYAGGKIMTFLASCPTDLRGDDWRPLTRKNLPRTTVGLGGFGGAVQKNGPTAMNGNGDGPFDGVTVATAMDEETGGAAAASLDGANGTPVILDTDMTPPSLLDYYRAPEHVEAYFQELGSQCAESALGVDIFVLVQPQEAHDFPGSDYRVGEYEDDGAELDVGLPFLRALADRSGAPGPLIFPLHQGYSTPYSANPNIQRLQREIYARVPWGAYDGENNDEKDETISLDNLASRGRHNVMGFGGELRMRLSPSFEVDKAPVDEVEEGPQLAPLYSSGGIMGPAAEEEESGNLWRFGTCDPFTSVTIDLDVKDAKVKDRLNVDGMGEISWKPVLQTCFAYTTIVNDPEQPGEYLTVRQMRIASARAHLTDSVETLYSSIDPEVIGAVLFHKLTLTLLRDGLSMAQTIGEDWLKSLLVCTYKSAETQEKIQRERAEHGLHQQLDSNGNGDNTTLTFYANERLLDREGELSAEEVLLAQGHELLKTLPLTVYSLLHCDAIRPSSSSKTANISSGYYPTMDARCAAGAQMSSMNPPILAKCISPRLQLWSCSEGLILDNLDLKMEAIIVAVEEFGNDARTGKSREDLVFFLDAPDSIVVCDARYISDSLSSQKKKKRSIIGVDLHKAINAALCSYRTPPTVLVDLVEPGKQEASSGSQGYRRLLAALAEDMPGSNGARNFNQWGDHLAEEIHEELEKDD